MIGVAALHPRPKRPNHSKPIGCSPKAVADNQHRIPVLIGVLCTAEGKRGDAPRVPSALHDYAISEVMGTHHRLLYRLPNALSRGMAAQRPAMVRRKGPH